MKFPTDLIFRFGRAIGSAEFDKADSTAEVPAGLLPVISLPGPLDTMTAPNSAVIQRETFPLAGAAAKVASTALDNVIVATFGRGLWRIQAMITHWSDFTRTPAGSDDFAQITIQDPEAASLALARLPTIANIKLVDRIDLTVLFGRDSFQLRRFMPATGVAQTMFTAVAGVASRLS